MKGALACMPLAIFTLVASMSIKYQNERAGHFLPHLHDGEWRVAAFPQSEEETARGELRGTVVCFGLPLYLINPFVAFWSGFALFRSKASLSLTSGVYGVCLAFASVSQYIVLSLQLFDSLGW